MREVRCDVELSDGKNEVLSINRCCLQAEFAAPVATAAREAAAKRELEPAQHLSPPVSFFSSAMLLGSSKSRCRESSIGGSNCVCMCAWVVVEDCEPRNVEQQEVR